MLKQQGTEGNGTFEVVSDVFSVSVSVPLTLRKKFKLKTFVFYLVDSCCHLGGYDRECQRCDLHRNEVNLSDGDELRHNGDESCRSHLRSRA